MIAAFLTDLSDCGVLGRAGDATSRSIDCGRVLLPFLERAALIPDSFVGLLGVLFSGTAFSLMSTLVDRLGLDSEPSPIIAISPCSDATGVFAPGFELESLDQNAHVEPADGLFVCAVVCAGGEEVDGGASFMTTSSLGFCEGGWAV